MIVVTGASRGLGQAVAERLKRNGEEVVGLARSAPKSHGEFIECDVGDYLSVKEAARKIRSKKQPVTAVINAAGIAAMNMAVTTDQVSVEKIIRTNLIGTIHCCQLFAPMMLRQKFGSFINFSTIAVPLALKGETVYSASKAGVEAFSRGFAREVGEFNIRVNCIAPGPINTDLLKGITEAQIEKIVEQQIIKKQFEKTDVCDLVDLLLDERASPLTGQVFHVGGV